MAVSGMLRRAAFWAVAPFSLLLTSCGERGRAGAWSAGSNEHGGVPANAPCDDGTTRECHVTLSEREGVLTCLTGVEQCLGGAWGDCEGELSTRLAPIERGALRAQSFSTPVDCDPENPCDPSCQQYDEDPGDPLEADYTPGGNWGGAWDWQWGTLRSFPPGLVKKGLREPCSSAFECQFDMYCVNPAPGSCGHPLCEEGAAVAYDCDGTFQNAPSCTGMICDIDPTCCTKPPGCVHDPCMVGVKLKSNCDPCVTQICADPSYAYCCTGIWDAACAARITSCGNTCECSGGATLYGGSCYHLESDLDRWSDQRADCTNRGPGWDLVVVDDAAENAWLYAESGFGGGDFWIGASSSKSGKSYTWRTPSGAGLPYSNWESGYGAAGSNEAGHMAAGSGGQWRDAGISSNLPAVCEGSPTMLAPVPVTHAWTGDCVDMVQTVCGAYCDASSSASGDCVPWQPGATDPSCNGDGSPGSPNVDLAVAPTCGGVIPICNHGTGTAPAGVTVVSFQGYSSHFPLCAPSFAASDVEDTCVTTEEIPPGECIELTGCDLDNNGGVLVNPHGAAFDPVEECSCLGNWSLVHPASQCRAPSCGSADGYHEELVSDCELVLPDSDYAVPGRVLLEHLYDDGDDLTSDDPVDFDYLAGAGACNGTTDAHWHYDNAASPTKIVLCPKTCQRVQNVMLASSDLWLELSCTDPSGFWETSFFQSYEGVCGRDRGVQWADLAYTASIPSDSSVVWKIAAGGDPADLPTDAGDPDWITVSVSTSGEENCPVGSGCEIDLFAGLGGLPDAGLPFLAVLITLVPSTDQTEAPAVADWDITYSCPYNQ